MEHLFVGLCDPRSCQPAEYNAIFEKGVLLIHELLGAIEGSLAHPEMVQDEVVKLVIKFKEIIAMWWESQVLKLVLEDQKAIFLTGLARMVKEAKLITGPETSLNDRASYMVSSPPTFFP